MKKVLFLALGAISVVMLVGCSTPAQRVSNLRLGMTPDEVYEEMGRPYAVRSAKLFADGTFQEVWEYIPSIFSVALFADRYDKTFWMHFDDGRLVQWGEPGDMTGSSTIDADEARVQEFRPDRRTR